MRLGLLLICCLAMPFVYASAAPQQVKVCLMDTDLFPLWRAPGQESAPLPGINVELQHRIVQSLGVNIVWVRAPFPRCLVLLKQNEVDLFNVASYNADRERYGLYPKRNGEIDHSRRLKSDSYHAYTLLNSPLQWDGQQFSNMGEAPIAIEIGASIRSMLNEMNLPVYEVSRVSQAFGMLQRGRVSAVVTNRFNGLSYSNEYVNELSPAVLSKSYFIMIAKQFYAEYPQLAERIWDESERVRIAEHAKLLERYSSTSHW
jgi:polar amino acid transport system substrate-binding protein